MTVLVDTCGLLFALLAPDRLTPTARQILEDRSSRLVWSTVSTWEVMIKVSLGKVSLGGEPAAILSDQLVRMGMTTLPLEQAHALRVARLPQVEFRDASGITRRHADPFDRLLVAQAIVEDMPILTADATFAAYPVRRVW